MRIDGLQTQQSSSIMILIAVIQLDEPQPHCLSNERTHSTTINDRSDPIIPTATKVFCNEDRFGFSGWAGGSSRSVHGTGILYAQGVFIISTNVFVIATHLRGKGPHLNGVGTFVSVKSLGLRESSSAQTGNFCFFPVMVEGFTLLHNKKNNRLEAFYPGYSAFGP